MPCNFWTDFLNFGHSAPFGFTKKKRASSSLLTLLLLWLKEGAIAEGTID
jgi:hypothetical protein